MDKEQMQMGIEVLWWLSQAYPPQFITLRCQNWPGETSGRWCCQSMCSENGVKMLVKMDRAQCRGVNADRDLMVIDPDGRSLLDWQGRVDEEVAGWWWQVGRPGQSIALDGHWERNLENFGLGGGVLRSVIVACETVCTLVCCGGASTATIQMWQLLSEQHHRSHKLTTTYGN